MTASVTSGFAPAALSAGTIGVTAAAPEGDGEQQGLFAALLSMLGATPAGDAEVAAPVTLSVPAVLPETAAAPLLETIDLPAVAGAAQTEQGKSLLKTLGDALIAINDALAAGKPIDPALEKKLSDALDAVAVYLGTVAPSAPQIDAKISALASGEGILPQPAPVNPAPPPVEPVPAPDLEVAPAEAIAADDAPTEDAGPVPAAQAFVSPVAAANTDLPAVAPAGLPIVAGTAATVATPTADAQPAIVPAQSAAEPEAVVAVSAPLAKLGKLIEDLGTKLAPELAARLDDLAKALKSGSVPPALIAELSSVADADPEIARIVEALAAPRPVAPKSVAAQPFTAPTLILPEAVAAKSTKPDADRKAAPPSIDAAEAPAPLAPESASRKVALRPTMPDNQPAEAKPAATGTAAPQTAPATDPGATPAPAPTVLAAGAAAAARTIHAAYQAPVQQVNIPQVAFEVVRQFEAGSSRFQIRLDPAELGRIDVRLDVDKSGTISARMTVERPETLDLLQRDQRALQQALQQAGLDGAKTSLEFSLRQNPFAQHGGMGDGRGDQAGFNGRGDGFAGGDDKAAEAATTTYRGTASAGGLNLFV